MTNNVLYCYTIIPVCCICLCFLVSQIVPLFLMDLLGDLHGLPGLFTAAVFAASLSSISSAVNSLSAVLLEDFVKPAYTMTCAKEPLSERAELWTTRILGLPFAHPGSSCS